MHSGARQGSVTRRMMGLTWYHMAPVRSISGPPQGSGRWRLQELTWGALGAHFGLQGSSSAVELELIFSKSKRIMRSRHREVRGEPENVTL